MRLHDNAEHQKTIAKQIDEKYADIFKNVHQKIVQEVRSVAVGYSNMIVNPEFQAIERKQAHSLIRGPVYQLLTIIGLIIIYFQVSPFTPQQQINPVKLCISTIATCLLCYAACIEGDEEKYKWDKLQLAMATLLNSSSGTTYRTGIAKDGDGQIDTQPLAAAIQVDSAVLSDILAALAEHLHAEKDARAR